MGKYLAILGGLVSIILGILFLTPNWWWRDFLTVLKGGLPPMLIFGGLIALIAGIGEVKDAIARAREKKEEEKK
ncbi:MAG: hypothetical protein NC920_02740 [Candidatus Omnitrophica bacterium]|nr:hypothetical protein [Candidatus Omnitrophota bacterium]